MSSKAAPVVISLQVGGIADVKRAFQAISDLVVQSAQKSTRAAQESDKATIKAAQNTAKEKERLARQTAKAAEAAEKAAVKSAANAEKEKQRIARQAQKAAETSEKLKAKAADSAAKETVRAWMKSDREVDRLREKSLRDTERTEAAKQRATERTAKEAERAEARKTKAVEREEKKRIASAEREAKKVARETKKAAAGAERDAQGRRTAFANQLTGATGRVVGGAMALGGAAVALGGGFTIADAVQRSMAAEGAAVDLANSMYNPNDEEQVKYLKGGRFNKKDIMSFASRAQIETGVDQASFMAGTQDYIAKSSDWKAVATGEGQQTLVDLAKLSKASGADFGQVMSAAGSLRVQNKDLDPKAMMDMMYSIVGQGKMGAVEIKDLAQHAAVITSTSGSYKQGEGGYKNQAQAQAALLGLSQIAVQTSGSSAEAATAVKSFGSDLNAKAGKAEASFAGLKLRDKEHKLLKVSDLAQNIFEATKGDVSRMGEGKGNIGLGRESIRIMQALDPIYTTALAKERGNLETDKDWKGKSKEERDKEARKRASKAVGDEVRRFEGASYSKEDSQRDFSEKMDTQGERINKAFSKLMLVAEEKVAPFIERLATGLEKNGPKIEKVFDLVASFAGKVADNPLQGVGAIIGASIAADIAKAQLGTMVSKALESSLGAKLGGTIAIAAAAVAITQVGMMAIDTVMDQRAKEQTKNSMSYQDADSAKTALSRKLAKGEAVSQDEINAAQKALTEGRAKVDSMKGANAEDAKGDKMIRRGIQAMTLGLYDGGEGLSDAQKTKQTAAAASAKRAEESLNELANALKAATEAAKANAAANGSGGKANPNDPSRSQPLSSGARGGAH